MKKISTILIILLSIIICCCREEDNNKCQHGRYVLAGGKSDCIIYKDLVPDIELGIKGIRRDSIRLDLNGDNIPDLNFESRDTISSFIIPLNKYTHVSLNSNFMGDGSYAYELYQSIDSLAYWSPSVTITYNPSIFTLPTITFCQKDPNFKIGTWHNTLNHYLGVRYIESKDTIYGWVGISVIGYSHIVIHDYAYQKKNN